jgi:hypothetical protein
MFTDDTCTTDKNYTECMIGYFKGWNDYCKAGEKAHPPNPDTLECPVPVPLTSDLIKPGPVTNSSPPLPGHQKVPYPLFFSLLLLSFFQHEI